MERKGRRAKGAKILNYINSIPVAHLPCHATWKGLVKRTAIGLASPPTRRFSVYLLESAYLYLRRLHVVQIP